jgi:hypothetical protein
MDSKPFTPIVTIAPPSSVSVGGYINRGAVSYGGTVTVGKGGVSGAIVGIRFRL